MADEVGCEFVVEMRRDSRFETRLIAGVIAFDDLRDFVQAGNHAGFMVRHDQFHELANRSELAAEFIQQQRNALSAAGANGDAMGILLKKASEHIPTAVELINFVEDHQCRFAFSADFFEDGINRFDLFLRLRMADIDDVEEEIGLDDFLERRLESFDEPMRQFANEPDRVGEQHILVGGEAQSTGRGIERGEQFILGQDLGPGERVEQSGFAGVRISDDRGEGPMVSLPSLALSGTLAADDLEFARDPRDPILNSAAVGLELRFTFTTPHADTAFLARKVTPEPGEAGQQVLELRKFDLQLAFAGAGALGKDIEDQRGAIENFAVEYFLEITALRGGEFVIENDGIDISAMAEAGKFVGLAFADKSGGVGSGHFLQPVAHDMAARGGG